MAPGFLNAVLWRSVATLSSLATGLITLRLVGRHLEPASYGVVLVALQLLSYLPLLDGGVRTTVNRSLLAGDSPGGRAGLLRFGQTFYSLLALAVLAVALVVMTGYALTPLAAAADVPPVFFLVVGVSAAIGFITSVQAGLLVGLRGQSDVFVLGTLNAWVNAGALWLALRQGAGLWAFPLSQLAMSLATYPLALWLIRQRAPGLKIFSWRVDREFRDTLRAKRADAWACFRSQLSIMLLFTVDVLLVGVWCGAKQAAVYGVLTRVFGILRNVLQATGEAAWPIVAERGTGAFALPLLQLNAWVYGSVMGAVCLSLGPFLGWYMGEDWAAPRWVLYLMVARYLVTGVSSPAAFFLLGLGRFRDVARRLERELAVAVVLALALGPWLGLSGVAGAFLIATCLGTFTPILTDFARVQQLAPGRLLGSLWWRALAGLAVSWTVMTALQQLRAPAVLLVPLAATAAAAGVGVGWAVAWIRARASTPAPTPPISLRDMLKRW